MPTTLRETGARLGEATPGRPSRREVTIITEGWGSSGYYSRDLLERDGPAIFPVGTQMFLDHPGRAEESDRPERSVKDLAARLASTPRMVGNALVAEADIYEHWRPVVDALAEDIGLSIRAAGETELGEADGRKGTIVTSLTEGISVDFVTNAGRGGKVGQLIESAQAAVKEALASDVSAALNAAAKERWGGRDRYVYIDDYDPDEGWAVFSVNPETGDRKFLRVEYEVSDTEVKLALDALEVRRTTAYVPAPSVVTEAGAARQTKEANMADEKTLAALQESVSKFETRLTETETKLTESETRATAAETRADRAEETLADMRADKIVREATIDVDGAKVSVFHGLKESAVSRCVKAALAEALPRTEDGKLDETKLTERATAAAKSERDYLAEHSTNGRVQGFGGSRPAGGNEPDTKELEEAFKGLGLDDKAAQVAATGR